MHKTLSIATALLLALSLTACGSNDNDQTAQQNDNGSSDSMSGQSSGSDGMAGQSKAQNAVAQMKGLKGHEDISGTITFKPASNGLSYTAQVQNLPQGKHGYHIHVKPDCSAPDGKSAGTHFNLEGSSRNPPKDIDRITGNLGNLDAGDNGKAKADGKLAHAALTGDKGLIGHSIIIHAKPNDPEQPPMGATGARIACGVIKAGQGQS